MSNDLVNNNGMFKDGDPLPEGLKTQTQKILEKENSQTVQTSTSTLTDESKEGRNKEENEKESEIEIDDDIVKMFSEDKIKILYSDQKLKFKEFNRIYPDAKTIYHIESLISKYLDLNNNLRRFNDRITILYQKKAFLEEQNPKDFPEKFDRLMKVMDDITELTQEFEKTEQFTIDEISFTSSNEYSLYLFSTLVKAYTGCSDDDLDNLSYHTYPNEYGAKGVFDIAISIITLAQRGPVFLAKKSKK